MSTHTITLHNNTLTTMSVTTGYKRRSGSHPHYIPATAINALLSTSHTQEHEHYIAKHTCMVNIHKSSLTSHFTPRFTATATKTLTP